MSTQWGSIDYRRLAENVTILRVLRREPEKPTENLPPPHLTRERDEPPRHLTFKRERDLVDHLAFLSAFSDDPLRVMAVCLEERPNSEGLIIRVAMNTGDLESVKERLMKIVAILEQVATRG